MPKKNRVGEKRIMNCGEEATIIAYRKATDLDVKFPDGTIVYHKRYGNFEKGQIENPNSKNDIKRLGEKQKMTCGQTASIIKYRDCHDIDVMFSDGTIIKHKTYSSFLKGNINNPNRVKENNESHIGESNIMNCGMEAIITAYRKSTDIDIKFSDGYEIKNTRYDRFKRGDLFNPNCTDMKGNHIGKRIGLRKRMNCGEECRIIAYRAYNDIDVEFSDGNIIRHRKFNAFKKGEIRNLQKAKIGEKRLQKCGLIAEVIKTNPFTVRFEDNEEIETRHTLFFIGEIIHPFLGTGIKKSIIQIQRINNDYHGFYIDRLLFNNMYQCECKKCRKLYPNERDKFRFIMSPLEMIEHEKIHDYIS